MPHVLDPAEIRCAELKLEILRMVYPGVGKNPQALESGILTDRLIKEVDGLWKCVSDITNKIKREETDV